MNKKDFRDWFVMMLVAALWAAATVYLFEHHSDMNYVTWGTISVTMAGVYHGLNIHDDKKPDEENPKC